MMADGRYLGNKLTPEQEDAIRNHNEEIIKPGDYWIDKKGIKYVCKAYFQMYQDPFYHMICEIDNPPSLREQIVGSYIGTQMYQSHLWKGDYDNALSKM